MTLIIGITCRDGIVLAADSAGSDPEIGTKQPFDKIKRLGTQPILYGGSGDVGLLQKIDETLKNVTPKATLKRTMQEIKRLIIPELKEACDLHVPYPEQYFNKPPCAILLFGCIIEGKPWTIEIERNGNDTVYGDNLGNFAAIGSGKPWAQAIYRPHLRTERDLILGKIFAYRVLEDSINLSAAFLAMPIHIHTISLDGTVEKVSKEDLDGIANTCGIWRNLERDAVGNLLAPKSEETEPEIPEP
jgi:ATP-dependent protease HslVU (ClpYQ) peptidase subunit